MLEDGGRGGRGKGLEDGGGERGAGGRWEEGVRKILNGEGCLTARALGGGGSENLCVSGVRPDRWR